MARGWPLHLLCASEPLPGIAVGPWGRIQSCQPGRRGCHGLHYKAVGRAGTRISPPPLSRVLTTDPVDDSESAVAATDGRLHGAGSRDVGKGLRAGCVQVQPAPSGSVQGARHGLPVNCHGRGRPSQRMKSRATDGRGCFLIETLFVSIRGQERPWTLSVPSVAKYFHANKGAGFEAAEMGRRLQARLSPRGKTTRWEKFSRSLT